MVEAGWTEQSISDAKRWFASIDQYSNRDFYEYDYSHELAKKHIEQFKTYYASIKDQL
jgi:hypothetical protein